MKIVISSGHGKKVRGASGYIDEVDEARKVVEATADYLRQLGAEVTTYHDNVSTSQNENLNRIVDFHNAQGARDLDVSVHFNAYETTSKPMGTEVLYVSSAGLDFAEPLASAIADQGFINRGPKKRTDLFFLNQTSETAILVETCFVDSQADVDIYHDKFDKICQAIAQSLAGEDAAEEPSQLPSTEYNENTVREMAANSEIAIYSWKDRGVAPIGYINGFALTWASVLNRWASGYPPALDMAKADTGNPDKDVMSWYKAEFDKIGMSNKVAGVDTLRHLFVLLLGLGMRESSGRYCEGRDMSADNVSSDTAEAGLYQTSYNAHSSSKYFDEIMADYENDLFGDGYLDDFREDVSCDQSSWSCYGSGQGRLFQEMCKDMPAFAVETCAIVLRNLRQHYGPINRKEAELKKKADQLLLQIQNYVLQEPEGPEVA